METKKKNLANIRKMSTGPCWRDNRAGVGLWQTGGLRTEPLLSLCDCCHVDRWPIIARFSDFPEKPDIFILQ